ncbi:MAG: cytidine/deoxycytidylate deaminase family protein [Candidatus Eremiobacteraeota bacterium]|nr:cytidine/deoxycytidylate deaminase family protein [Candidatus Eremiobacteraeota bacterium]
MSDATSLLAQAHDRPSWDAYFFAITRAVGTRATCSRKAVGAVLVKNKLILATGYNGAPAGLRHCDHTGGGDLLNGHCARSTHAEQNAIVQAARHGISIDGATLYCTNNPCLTCTKLIINAGVTKIVYKEEYPDPLSFELLRESGITLVRFGDDVH